MALTIEEDIYRELVQALEIALNPSVEAGLNDDFVTIVRRGMGIQRAQVRYALELLQRSHNNSLAWRGPIVVFDGMSTDEVIGTSIFGPLLFDETPRPTEINVKVKACDGNEYMFIGRICWEDADENVGTIIGLDEVK